MKIIAAIPAYDEEATIGSVVLMTKKYVDEVIVVDDGSKDKTAEVADLAGARIVKHERNIGYGAAIQSCFSAARTLDADVMVIMDADGQHNTEEIETLIQPIINKEADIVNGSRFLDKRSKIPFYRKIGMTILNKTTSAASKEVSDSQSGFRAYSKKAIKSLKLKEDTMGIGSEILIKAHKNNLKIKEIPINVRYDKGKSAQNPLDHGFDVIISIIKIISEKHPLMFFGGVGTVLLMFGLFSGYLVVKDYNRAPDLAVGSALITLLLVILGMFLMSTGVILYTLQDVISKYMKKE